MNLLGQQWAAVECEAADICVVAGPGSGKTRVLIERFAWLVERRGIDPGRILAITFTEKAANEMKQRLTLRFAHAPELREKIETAWLSTIDAFCARLLGEHAIEAGLPPDFAVLEPAQAARLQRQAAEDVLDELFAERPVDMRRLLEGLDLSTRDDGRQPDVAQALIDVYETMRLAGVHELPAAGRAQDVSCKARELAAAIGGDASLMGEGAAPLLDWVARFLSLPAEVAREHFAIVGTMPPLQRIPRKSAAASAASQLKKEILPRLEAQWITASHTGLPELLRTAIERLDRRFRHAKHAQSVVDFTDLEEKTIQLLESDSDLRRQIASRFDHLLMDELQDTNRLQWRLVALVRQNLFAVGDINQSIYGFRHADRTVFSEYRSRAQVLELTENYRSQREILRTIEQLVAGQPGVEHRALQAKRDCAAVRSPVVELFAGCGDRAEEDEAAQVASRIREWRDSNAYEFGDIAILVRTLNSTRPFEEALDRRNIPFLISGGRTFLEARETRDLMAFLAALVNPLDDIAMLTVLRSPLVGWSDERIMLAGREGWQQEFENLFGRIRRLAGFISPDRLIAQALDECGYGTAMNERARANIDKFLAWIRREDRARPRPLAELLDDLEALREIQAEAEAPPPDATDAVRIMTIHGAKGLEFPAVFVSAMHRRADRSMPAIVFDPGIGLGIKWRNPATGKGVHDAAHRAIADRRKREEDEEENRLLYVAMTRAEDRLILSYAERKQQSAWVKLASQIQPSIAVVDENTTAVPLPNGAIGPIFLERPVVSGQYDSAASVTSIALFSACPRKYFLSGYLGLEPEASAPGTGAVELGREVHRLLGGAGGPYIQPEIQHDIQQRSAMPGQGARRGPGGPPHELVRRFLESDLGRRVACASCVEREFDFQFALEDVVLRGQIDLWFEEGGELILVDYKTDRDESGFERYALQLRLYALALKQYTGRIPDRAVLLYLRSVQAMEVDLNEESLENARSAVRAFSAAQQCLDFPMKVGEQCSRCIFWKEECEGRS